MSTGIARNAAPYLGLLLAFASSSVSAEPPTGDYLQDIKPIFQERCFACHGALKQEGGLRLDSGELVRKGADSGPVVLPAAVAESPLLKRVSAQDAAERMPPEGEPLTSLQIASLQAWIAQGAPSPASEQPERDPREHWSFRTPVRPPLPAGTNAADHPIDAFLAHRLQASGLQPQPAAEKHVQLRRVYLDLVGVPPTAGELHNLLGDDSPLAYERVVDRLLQDPRYGERWARHWMDVWRYSDWYGRRHVPDVWNSAPQIWRWRDWIVKSLNADRGYDRLLQEMLAGDEIAPEDDEAGYATGYLIRNWYALNPNDWMRSTVEHTGKAFLGLTFNCAHCHDHKYDPIAHEDYFRLRAFFEPLYIRQDQVPGEADPGPFQDYVYSTLRKIQRLGAVRVFDKTPEAPTWFYTGGDERNRVSERGSVAPGLPAFLAADSLSIEPVDLPPRAWYPGLRPGIQETLIRDAEAALAKADEQVAAAQQAGQDAAVAEAQAAAARAALASLQARIAADRARYEAGAEAAAESGEPTVEVTQKLLAASRLEREAAVQQAEVQLLVQQRALADAEGKPAEDAARAKAIETATQGIAAAQMALDKARAALADESLAQKYTPLSPTYPRTSTGRRRALALWLTARDNPLTARVAINHIWLRHFHAPLVATVYDFGRNGAAPTHPELLDWLAVELMESGWSMKHIHRLIVTSAAYRRSSSARDNAAALAADPENRLLWRMNTGRMEAEVVRDSILSCADRLVTSLGGQELENGESLSTFRRSLYYSVFPEDGGKSPLGILFDAPDPLECYRRTRSVMPQQALALTNSELVHQMSAQVVEAWAQGRGGDELADERFIREAFERILSRSPSAAELAVCGQAMAQHRRLQVEAQATDPDKLARESLVRALFNHNDFVTIR